jgi:hypothetical protein
MSDFNRAAVTEDQLEAADPVSDYFSPGCEGYYFIFFNFTSKAGGSAFALLVQVGAPTERQTDKTALNAAIARVTGENAANWYQTGDRYNGNPSYTIRPDATPNSFWAGMQTVLGTAQEVTGDNTVYQIEVDTAAANLENSIARLIPKTRVNATGLYEAVQAAEAEKAKAEGLYDFTPYTLEALNTALDSGQALLDSLYYQPGNAEGKPAGDPTPLNAAAYDEHGGIDAEHSYQDEVDAAAGAVSTANGNLLKRPDLELWKPCIDSIPTFYSLTAGLDESDFGDGWSQFQTAREDAYNYYLQYGKNQDTLTNPQLDRLIWRYQALYESYYFGLKNASGSISVSARLVDSLALKNPGSYYPYYSSNWVQGGAQWQARSYPSLTLSGGNHTVGDLLSEMGVPDDDREELAVFINGVLACEYTYSNLEDTVFHDPYLFGDVMLHNGDDVVVARLPRGEGAYYIDVRYAELRYTKDYIGLARFEDADGNPLGDTMHVKEGQAFDLYVKKTPAASSSYTGRYTPFTTAKVYSSAEGVRSDDYNEALAPTLDSGAAADADGKVSVALYGTGWQFVYAADLNKDVFSVTSAGTSPDMLFPTLTVGAGIWVHVDPLSAGELKTALDGVLSDMDAYYGGLNRAMFTDSEWSTVTGRYNDGKTAISGAADLAAAKRAYKSAVADINALLAQVNERNTQVMTKAGWSFSHLPTVNEIAGGWFTAAFKDRFEYLKTLYDGMTDYQKSLLTGAQQAQYDALLAAYGADGSTLPGAKPVKVNIVLENGQQYADTFDIQHMIDFIPYFNSGVANRTYTADHLTNPDIFTASMNPYSSYTLMIGRAFDRDRGGHIRGYEIYNLKIDGATPNYVSYDSKVKFEMPGTTQNREVTNYYRFDIMPCGDITVSFSIRPVGETTYAEKIDIKKSDLTSLYGSYDKADYTQEGWVELTAEYNAGLAALDAAADEAALASAYDSAAAAMAAVAKRPATGGETVGTLGSVYVTVENSTSKVDNDGNKIPSQFTGKFVDAAVPLNRDTTMMTAVLTALEQNGYTWIGTGGAPSGKGITYLASIIKDGYTLAEFTCGQQSGWMGTLNDWFTNEGFQSFRADASNKNYRLVDGDEIAVQYTTKGYGADLGGSWGNANTSLKSLDINGGKLSPTFGGRTLSYILDIGASGSARVAVTPVASNKNYQVRTYLNETSGNNWYRKSQSIPVKPGDTINIGVGEYSWPSMNNQSTEKISYTGTWYSVRIVNSSGSDDVIALISQIPKITYSNYKVQQDRVTLARGAYDALTDAAKSKVTNYAVLTEAEENVSRYAAIDTVKSLLEAVPAANKLTIADKSKVQAAYDAYSRLDDEQRLYITVGDVAKYNAAIEWLKKQGVENLPRSIQGSAKVPGENAVLTPKATVSDGAASAAVSASDMTTAIADTLKNEGTTIVIAPEITGTVKKVNVNLPKASLSSVASDTDADLKVETPVGNMTIPNGVLASIVSQASGSTVTVSLESVNKETALNRAQKETVGENPVYDVSILSGSQRISSFDGGSITVSLPYTLKDGEDPDGVTVWYLNDAGELEKMTCTYNKATGLATFKTTHLSYYVVGYSEAWNNPFTDVKDTDWFYGAVEFAVRNGLFNGTAATVFSPNAQMTRAMLVTVLYRMDQAAKAVTGGAVTASGPAVTTGAVMVAQNFTDVKDGQWYTDAVLWASANGITAGIGNGLFGTDSNVTREQMATILYNYSNYKGYEMTITAAVGVESYADAPAVSAWAQTPMKWANGEGLITGRTVDTLAPGGSATRAEVATILQRFTQGVAK